MRRSPQKATDTADRFKLTPNNAAAGQKRKSEEPESASRTKSIKAEQQNGIPSRPAAIASAPASRFQLSVKTTAAGKSSPVSQRLVNVGTTSINPQKAVPKHVPKSAGIPNTSTLSRPADGPTTSKKGYASVLEKAKAAQEAAKASNSVGGITHKAAEKLTKKDKLRLREEAMAQQKGAKQGPSDRSRSGTPAGLAGKAGMPGKKIVLETSYKGTMKKAAEPLGYKGTMRAVGSTPKPPPKKGMAQDKYGGYASWSDLDDAEDEEEGFYDSGSDDMEAGLDDVEAEESAALRLARKEDQEALEEEERLKREKLERKRKLQALSQTAAGKKRY